MDKPIVLTYDGSRESLSKISKSIKGIFTETGRGKCVKRPDGSLHFYWQFVSRSNQGLTEDFVYEYFVLPGQIVSQKGFEMPVILDSISNKEML